MGSSEKASKHRTPPARSLDGGAEHSGVVAAPIQAVLERCKRRDRDALTIFFTWHEKGLFAYFAGPRHWHAHHVADLVQETIVAAIRAFPRMQATSAAQARGWLYGVARNVHLKQVSKQVGIRLRLDVAAELARTTTDAYQPGTERRDLLVALNQLPLGQVEVLRLVLQGLTIREIAGRLDLPDGTVATRIHRAKKQLRALLVGDDG